MKFKCYSNDCRDCACSTSYQLIHTIEIYLGQTTLSLWFVRWSLLIGWLREMAPETHSDQWVVNPQYYCSAAPLDRWTVSSDRLVLPPRNSKYRISTHDNRLKLNDTSIDGSNVISRAHFWTDVNVWHFLSPRKIETHLIVRRTPSIAASNCCHQCWYFATDHEDSIAR